MRIALPDLETNARMELLTKIDESAEAIRARCGGAVPSILVVAGSGLGGFAQRLGKPVTVPYGEIPNFPVSSVAGHAGTLVKGTCAGRDILVMNGRKHLYEGAAPEVITLPLRALLRAGVHTVILSNAAGGLNPKFEVGDLMLITDHVNGMFQNPLVGRNIDAMGVRFPDMSEPYSRALQTLARETAQELGIALREGVYWGGHGPTYETKAEVQLMRQFSDVVGMSTVPETIVAVHANARVLGISVITNSHTNPPASAHGSKTSHEEVMEIGKLAGERFCRLVEGIVSKL